MEHDFIFHITIFIFFIVFITSIGGYPEQLLDNDTIQKLKTIEEKRVSATGFFALVNWFTSSFQIMFVLMTANTPIKWFYTIIFNSFFIALAYISFPIILQTISILSGFVSSIIQGLTSNPILGIFVGIIVALVTAYFLRGFIKNFLSGFQVKVEEECLSFGAEWTEKNVSASPSILKKTLATNKVSIGNRIGCNSTKVQIFTGLRPKGGDIDTVTFKETGVDRTTEFILAPGETKIFTAEIRGWCGKTYNFYFTYHKIYDSEIIEGDYIDGTLYSYCV